MGAQLVTRMMNAFDETFGKFSLSEKPCHQVFSIFPESLGHFGVDSGISEDGKLVISHCQIKQHAVSVFGFVHFQSFENFRSTIQYIASTVIFDVYLLAGFGVLGYIFSKLKCEPAPLLLGFILGPMMEEYLRRALLLSRGDFSVLVTRPISATMLAIATIALIVVFLPSVRKKREEAFQEE